MLSDPGAHRYSCGGRSCITLDTVVGTRSGQLHGALDLFHGGAMLLQSRYPVLKIAKGIAASVKKETRMGPGLKYM
jgi:hypothetical protein